MSGASLRRRLRIAALSLGLVLCGRLASAAILTQNAAPPRESARLDVERALPPMHGDRLRVALVEEDADQAHLVSANASDSVPVTFLAYFVCDGDGPRTVALTREIPR